MGVCSAAVRLRDFRKRSHFVILSDRDLRERLSRGDLVVEPLENPELQIQPASIDLRLDKSFVAFRASRLPCIDPRDIPADATERIEIADGESFGLHPGDFVLGSTI